MSKKVKKPIGIYFISAHLYMSYFVILSGCVRHYFPEININNISYYNYFFSLSIYQQLVLFAPVLPFVFIIGFLKLNEIFMTSAVVAMFIAPFFLPYENAELDAYIISSILTVCSFIYINRKKFNERRIQYFKYLNEIKNKLIIQRKKLNMCVLGFYVFISFFLLEGSYLYLLSINSYFAIDKQLIDIDINSIRSNINQGEGSLLFLREWLPDSALSDTEVIFFQYLSQKYPFGLHVLIFIIVLIIFFVVMKISYMRPNIIKHNKGKSLLVFDLIKPIRRKLKNRKIVIGEHTLITRKKLYISLFHLSLLVRKKKKHFIYILRHELFHLKTYDTLVTPLFINFCVLISFFTCAIFLVGFTFYAFYNNPLILLIMLCLCYLGFFLFKLMYKFQADYRKYGEHLADLYAYECLRKTLRINIDDIFSPQNSSVSYHPSEDERLLFIKNKISNLPINLFVYSNLIFIIFVGLKFQFVPSNYLSFSYMLLMLFLLINFPIFKLVFKYQFNSSIKIYSHHVLISSCVFLLLWSAYNNRLNVVFILYFIYLSAFYLLCLWKMNKCKKFNNNISTKKEKIFFKKEKIFNFIMFNGKIFTSLCILDIGVSWAVIAGSVPSVLFMSDLFNIKLIAMLFIIYSFFLIIFIKNLINKMSIVGVVLEFIFITFMILRSSTLSIVLDIKNLDSSIQYYSTFNSPKLFFSDLFSYVSDGNIINAILLDSYASILIIIICYITRILSIKRNMQFY